MKIKFYTLLYIDLSENRILQGAERTGRERLGIFVKNIILLNRSLRVHNPDLDNITVLTNNTRIINEILSECGYSDLQVDQIQFDFNVPKGIKFYSAHFKIDAFRYFATRPDDEYSILLDNDIVELKPLTTTFYDVVSRREPMCYHLNEAHADVIQADCRKINPSVPIVEWVGGEFIGGVNAIFKMIYDECIKYSNAYFEQLNNGLFHIGDEMLTSISIAQIASNGIRFIDVGALGFLYRYWGMHEHESIEHYSPIFAHLPADKVWLASYDCKENFETGRFLKSYGKHLRFFRFIKKFKKIIRK